MERGTWYVRTVDGWEEEEPGLPGATFGQASVARDGTVETAFVAEWEDARGYEVGRMVPIKRQISGETLTIGSRVCRARMFYEYAPRDGSDEWHMEESYDSDAFFIMDPATKPLEAAGPREVVIVQGEHKARQLLNEDNWSHYKAPADAAGGIPWDGPVDALVHFPDGTYVVVDEHDPRSGWLTGTLYHAPEFPS